MSEPTKFPHRRRLRDLAVSNIEIARSQIPGATDYALKQLERYVVDMQTVVALMDSMKEEHDVDPE